MSSLIVFAKGSNVSLNTFMKRLFLAIDIPEDIRDELLDLRINSLDVNWTSWDNYHLTLKFLGDNINRHVESDIIHKIERLSFEKMTLSLSSVGYFGSERNPRVLYAGLESSELLMDLQKGLVDSLRSLDLDLEKSKYIPHVTLGRPKKLGYDKVAQFMQHFSTFRSRSFEVDRYYLMESELTRHGPYYSILHEFELKQY